MLLVGISLFSCTLISSKPMPSLVTPSSLASTKRKRTLVAVTGISILATCHFLLDSRQLLPTGLSYQLVPPDAFPNFFQIIPSVEYSTQLKS